ncbi:MAG: hypothetical protein AB7O38_26050 [Pirellulaceae bacterium]
MHPSSHLRSELDAAVEKIDFLEKLLMRTIERLIGVELRHGIDYRPPPPKFQHPFAADEHEARFAAQIGITTAEQWADYQRQRREIFERTDASGRPLPPHLIRIWGNGSIVVRPGHPGAAPTIAQTHNTVTEDNPYA